MFKELAPLLRQRPVVLLLNPLEGESLRVIVMPKKLNDTEEGALATPLSITGTPEELDEQLPATLTQYVGAHLELKNTLQMAKDEMDAAAKAARSKKYPKAETHTKAETAKAQSSTTTETKPGQASAKPAAEKKAAPPITANLFSFDESPVATEPVEPDATPDEEESEILAEVDHSGSKESPLEDAA